jgi:multidrug efflux pump subunit AcrA (membrane-fusion protein)
MLRHLGWIAMGCVLTLIGLVGGWFAGQQGAAPAAEGGHSEAEHAAADKSKEFDKRTLANIGVTIAPAQRTTFVRHRAVQAVIEDRPRNLHPLVSPLGGIIVEVKAEVGSAVDAGAPVLVLARDPIARPKPDLTASILKPISEEVHQGVSTLRAALGQLKIADANLARVAAARRDTSNGEFPILRRSEIEYQNERAGILLRVESARQELERHGLSADEIAAVEQGRKPPVNAKLWAHALEHNGLWPAAADAIRDALPTDLQDAPWATAAIGELAANGLATPALAAALTTAPEMKAHFGEVAGLLLEGTPLETISLIAAAGGLDASVVLRAPAGVDYWDVQDVLVRPGQRVAAGEILARLHDARTLWLRLEPIGNEVGFVVRALRAGTALEARPLLPDSGPVLEGLRLARMATFSDAHERGGRAYAEVQNTHLCPGGTDSGCSWSLRIGLRYVVRVPVEELEGRFVFPVGAVTSRGPDRVVYVQDGETFRAQPVRIDFEDDEVTVIADDGGIFEGDPVAMSGAFALGLAMQSDPKAANSHGHEH